MTRTEQINQVLESYPNKYDNGNPESVTAYNEGYDDGFETGFVEGAAWADANTCCWHKYPDDKPSKNGEYLAVFTSKYPEFNGKIWIEKTMFLDGGFCSLIFDEERDSEIDCLYKEDVIAWMELPQPPKFD